MHIADNASVVSGNTLTLNLIGNTAFLALSPELISTNYLKSNFLSSDSIYINNNSNLNVDIYDGEVSIGNFDNIYIGGETYNPTSISINTHSTSGGLTSIGLYGDLTSSGNITVGSESNLWLDDGLDLNSGGNINLTATGSIDVAEGAILTSSNSIILDSNNLIINGLLQAGSNSQVNNTLLINLDGSIDPSSTIIPAISGDNISVAYVAPSIGIINIHGNLTGNGILKAYNGSGNINITNNSSSNLSLSNLLTISSGLIFVNGNKAKDDISTSTGVIDVVYDNSSGSLGNITIQNNSTSYTKLDGAIEASNLNINSQGRILLFNDTIDSNVVLNTTIIAKDGPAEIMLGNYYKDLTINGNLNSTATNGNIYYYGGTVDGNAVFNSGEAFDNRYSLALGRYRDLDITGDLDITSAGHVVHFGGTVGGDVTVDAAKMVGFMDVAIGGDLDVDALAFGFFGGSVGGDMNIDAEDGILIGVGNLLTVSGNADLDSLYGPVGYYLGDVGGNLTIDAGGIVNVGNVDLLSQLTLDYNGQTYDVTDLPYPVPADNNDFSVGGTLDISTPADVDFEGQVTGLVNIAGDNINHVENGDVNIDTMASGDGDINIEANTGSVDINYISTTGDIDIDARDGINIDTIDPANINLTVQKEGGLVNIDKAQVSNSVNIKADNIKAVFENLNTSKALAFNLAGNDGNLANDINVSASSSTGLVFNNLKSVNAELKNLTNNTTLKINNATVSNLIDIRSDIIETKDNVIFNSVKVSDTNGTAKPVIISNLGDLKADNNVVNINNLIRANNKLIADNSSLVDLDNSQINNDINQVNKTAEDKLGEDLTYNVENSDDSFSVNKASGTIIPEDAEFYLDENFENYTKELLGQANKIYNQALGNGESEEQAKEKAKQFLLNSKLSPEIAKKLLEKQDFSNNANFSKVLKLISMNN